MLEYSTSVHSSVLAVRRTRVQPPSCGELQDLQDTRRCRSRDSADSSFPTLVLPLTLSRLWTGLASIKYIELITTQLTELGGDGGG